MLKPFFWRLIQFWINSRLRIIARTFRKLIIQWLIHELPGRSAWNSRTKPRVSRFYIARQIIIINKTSLNCEPNKDGIENAPPWVCSELNKLSEKIGFSMLNAGCQIVWDHNGILKLTAHIPWALGGPSSLRGWDIPSRLGAPFALQIKINRESGICTK